MENKKDILDLLLAAGQSPVDEKDDTEAELKSLLEDSIQDSSEAFLEQRLPVDDLFYNTLSLFFKKVDTSTNVDFNTVMAFLEKVTKQ